MDLFSLCIDHLQRGDRRKTKCVPLSAVISNSTSSKPQGVRNHSRIRIKILLVLAAVPADVIAKQRQLLATLLPQSFFSRLVFASTVWYRVSEIVRIMI